MIPGEGFPAALRVRRGTEYRRAYASRVVEDAGFALVHACGNGLSHPRLGLSVSRRVGGAVVRNRVKRLLREAFRKTRTQLPAGIDFVVSVRRHEELALDAYARRLSLAAGRLAARIARDQGTGS